jgi:hypothetical protein
MNKQGGLMNIDLIKALRCKEYFDLCNVESCRYHLTNTKSGCKCAIKLMATDAATALDALRRAQPENEPVDAVPVVHGEWKKDSDYPWLLNCPVCGYSTKCGTNYCPDCGTKMEDTP